MLTEGIIRHSSSAFFSLVILVKKDALWCMCLDYNELNKVTMPEKYPILVVKELMDEIHEATSLSWI